MYPRLVKFTVRLPEKLWEQLEIPVLRGQAVSKSEVVRKAIEEYIENHRDEFLRPR